MSLINVTNVTVKNPVGPFVSAILLEITFECLTELSDELCWKLVYIGSARDEVYDQVLEEVVMGPLSPGTMQFTLEASAPEVTKIPADELLKITAIILQAHYLNQEFFRLGYYVYNQFVGNQTDSMMEPIDISKVQRSILSDKPRITRSPIEWKECLKEPSDSGAEGTTVQTSQPARSEISGSDLL